MAAVSRSSQSEEWVEEFVADERKRRRRHRLIVWAERVLVVCAFLGVWQALESFNVMQAILISSPLLVWHSLVEWVQQASFYTDLETTLLETLVGLVVGTAIGVGAGVLVGIRARVAKAVEPLFVAVYSVPIVLLVPLMTVWFGFGEFPKILIVALGVFYVMFINSIAGVGSADRALLYNLKVMYVGRVRIARELYLPTVTTWVIAGLRLAVAWALIGAIVAEFVAAKHGFGVAMTNAALFLNVPRVYAALVALAVLGLVLSGLVSLAEKWFLRWR